MVGGWRKGALRSNELAERSNRQLQVPQLSLIAYSDRSSLSQQPPKIDDRHGLAERNYVRPPHGGHFLDTLCGPADPENNPVRPVLDKNAGAMS